MGVAPPFQPSSYQQNMPNLMNSAQNVQPLPQQIPPMQQSIQQPVPQTGNFMYMENLQQVSNPTVVQNPAMINSQMMGMVSGMEYFLICSINRYSYIFVFVCSLNK